MARATQERQQGCRRTINTSLIIEQGQCDVVQLAKAAAAARIFFFISRQLVILAIAVGSMFHRAEALGASLPKDVVSTSGSFHHPVEQRRFDLELSHPALHSEKKRSFCNTGWV
ncbi:hypothetical protein I7I51_05014 [Histoplasma capsulatum]|uniref:Uncharacterized protein n=1 Tax=Ajellomyces capsulatus TaxID=5037 RepID=A0A8A1M7N8_AJECA|nr:hypothetical protein I7I51_05014 [Histoplasma capsulatum]